MNDEYIAGFFDADGYLTISKHAKNEEETPCFGFTNNIKSILEEIQKFIQEEYDIRGSISLKKARKPNHQDSYDLKYQGLSKCILLGTVIPFYHPKKVARWQLLKQLKALTPRNGKYSEEQLKERRLLCKKFLDIR